MRVSRTSRSRVHLVERVVGRVPPPAEARALARWRRRAPPPPRCRRAHRLLAHAHEHRRDADAPERLVAGAAHAVPVELWPPCSCTASRGERVQLRRGRARPPAPCCPWRPCESTLTCATQRRASSVPVRVGIPGRARIAPVRVARPEAEAQAAPPLAPARARTAARPPAWWRWRRHCPSRRNTRCRDGRRTCTKALVGVGSAGSSSATRSGVLAPAGIDLGMERRFDRLAVAHAASKRVAVLLAHAEHDRRAAGARRVLLGRAAPDRTRCTSHADAGAG